MNKEVTMTICWDNEELYEKYDEEYARELEDELPYETTFTMTDGYGVCEELDYLTTQYECLAVDLEEE